MQFINLIIWANSTTTKEEEEVVIAEEEDLPEAEEEEDQEEHVASLVAPKSSSSPIDYQVSSLLEGHKTHWSPKIWYQENQSTMKNVSVLRLTAKKLSTVFGTLTDPRLLPQLLVVSLKPPLFQELEYSISEAHQEPLFLTFLILLAQLV
jgi:hypothetical protein